MFISLTAPCSLPHYREFENLDLTLRYVASASQYIVIHHYFTVIYRLPLPTLLFSEQHILRKSCTRLRHFFVRQYNVIFNLNLQLKSLNFELVSGPGRAVIGTLGYSVFSRKTRPGFFLSRKQSLNLVLPIFSLRQRRASPTNLMMRSVDLGGGI